MKAWSFDENGFLNGQVECQPSPMEPGKFLIPAYATAIAPPDVIPEDKLCKIEKDQWVLIDRPKPVEEPTEVSGVSEMVSGVVTIDSVSG